MRYQVKTPNTFISEANPYLKVNVGGTAIVLDEGTVNSLLEIFDGLGISYKNAMYLVRGVNVQYLRHEWERSNAV